MLRSIGKQSGESVESVQLLLLDIITSPPIRERSTVISVSVCLSVCVCFSVSSELHVRSSPIFMHVNYGRGSVLFRRRSDTLCTSGFMDDVVLLISQGCSTSPPSWSAVQALREPTCVRPKEPWIRWDALWSHLANTIGRSVRAEDTALCHITLNK